jgi:hypothetical protein
MPHKPTAKFARKLTVLNKIEKGISKALNYAV